ncbi:MAG: flagellar basal body-associated FliL family protein [Lachnospiraceae bacterium]|nr:flagellar basal body-associated FliL family protein [Lachnospiraceae bacterium]
MKKNFVSIAILALLIVNIALTAIMMFSVMSTNKKTASLINDIATAINLELVDGTATAEEEVSTVSMADIELYTIADMTIPLKAGVNADGTADTKDHFALLSVSLSMNKTNEDYETYGADVSTKEDLIKGVINEVVSQYTVADAKNNSAVICDEILKKIQGLYNSDFIFDVKFSSALFQ